MMPHGWTGCHGWMPMGHPDACSGAGAGWPYAHPWPSHGGTHAGASTPTHGLCLPKELEATPDQPSASMIVGGAIHVRICVEYMSAGSGASFVKLSASEGVGTFTWTDSAITEGYHVKLDCPACAPGTKIAIEATNAIIRVRWMEVSGIGENH